MIDPRKDDISRMPAWLRGTLIDRPTRTLARGLRTAYTMVRRTLRGGRVRRALPSGAGSICLDFDFAIMNQLPAEDPLLAALLAHLKPDQVFYDVGAFVG